MMPTYTKTINEQVIHIQEDGSPNGPIAILIHGWSSSSFTWAPLIPTLSRRYRCITVDLPGFGRSPAPTAPPTIAGYADLIAQLIEAFSERAVLVLGHSMGGQIAATLALRHPPLVDQLVLLNPSLSGRLSTRVNMLIKPHVLAEQYPFMEWLIYLLAQTPLDYTDRLLKPTNFAERARAHVSPDDYQHIRADARRRGQGRVRAACFIAMSKGDLRGQIERIESSALVIWGAEDNIVPLRDAGAVAAEWPKADLRIIPNAGHWPQFEQTDATLRHIAQFLGLPPEIDDRHQAPEQNLARIQETAQFLNNSEIGGKLTDGQRLRLASLVHTHSYRPNEQIVSENTNGDEMYILKEGTLEVWMTPSAAGGRAVEPVRLAFLQVGQVAGELALLDGTTRSADLRAGPEGATLLALTQAALATLAEDDPDMGMRMMKNLAISLGRRLRNQNWRAARIMEAVSSRVNS
jgi:pimeloyl-ACP methyl ester carboxylesterase/CRP-like cAMP-binding protein